MNWASLKILVLAVAAVSGAANLSDVEQLRRENHVLKAQLHQALAERDTCRVQFAPIRFTLDQRALDAEGAKLKADIEAAHPGFTFNLQTGALEPKPPVPPEKK